LTEGASRSCEVVLLWLLQRFAPGCSVPYQPVCQPPSRLHPINAFYFAGWGSWCRPDRDGLGVRALIQQRRQTAPNHPEKTLNAVGRRFLEMSDRQFRPFSPPPGARRTRARRSHRRLTSMGSLLAVVIPLALGAAVSPTLFALEVLVLTGKHHPWPGAGRWPAERERSSWRSVARRDVLRTIETGPPTRSLTGAVIDLGAPPSSPRARSLSKARTAQRPTTSTPRGAWMTPPRSPSLASCSGHAVNFSTLVLFLPAVREIEHSSVMSREGRCLADHHRHRPPPRAPAGHPGGTPRTRADPLLARLNAFVGRHARLSQSHRIGLCRGPRVEGDRGPPLT